jgi:endonuclease/exonuclease/phosphatase family metal-dependent hydrolase
MNTNLLMRTRMVLDQKVREPTLLGLALTVLGFACLLGVCALAMAGLPAFGHLGWTFAAASAVSALLLLGFHRRRTAGPAVPTGRQRWLRHIRGWGRALLIGVLTSWLGLICWSTWCQGGPAPPPKADPALVRVVTWNIHCGQDEGPPWKQFDWPVRKHTLQAALNQARPDILCVQEATPAQVAFLEQALPGHQRFGVGRDDGKSRGEHCAVYVSRQRFEELDGGTFWLEEPTNQPRVGPLGVKRICTWVRLRDRVTGQTLRVYNTHLYLTEGPRRKAAELILAHIAAGDPGEAVLLAGDFNAAPTTPSRRLFAKGGLGDSAEGAGKQAGQPTFQLYGIGLWCLDGILVDRHWRVDHHRVLDVKPGNIFPSDHFAVLADLALHR